MRIQVLCALAILLAPQVARAQASTEARLREALRSATAQLHTLEEQQSLAQTREAEQKKQLEALRAELEAARAAAGKRSAGEGSALKARLAREQEASAKLTASLAQCQKSAADSAEATRAKEEERARAAGEKDALSASVAACEQKKLALLHAGTQFLDWLTGSGSGLCEPFLGLKRVELENRAQDYRDQILDLTAGKPSRSEDAHR